ncbi:hypothetical protein [Granulicella aggregans]|uniref:hypothetical protein n=1 Tax=Granulicella aggregans TaxID=474949 RepID=UPI0021E08C25|nr:hypothetical protein [Granulicella aggregans]
MIDSEALAKCPPVPQDSWLDLDALATVHITSEDSLFPIEAALVDKPNAPTWSGWRAARNGPQVVLIKFDHPVSIRRIHLRIVEAASPRSQEFAIYASSSAGDHREVVRQQFNFDPNGASEEIEDFTVDLHDVTVLELRIDPDRAHDPAQSQHCASLKSLRLA